MATTLYSQATPVPIAMSVNILRERCLTEYQPRWKNGQPAQSTTGVPPETMDLSFNEEVRLLKVDISSAESGEIDTGFTPSPEAASRFAVALPALEEGAYTVNWTIMGSDSHRVEGNFAFTVDPAATEVAGQNPEAASREGHAAHSGH